MSSQRGNSHRTRPQKYKNTTTFKNDLHDKTPKTKMINNIKIYNVCNKCKHILDWKIKYKKYKPLKTLKKCTKCEEKTIRDAYHTICNKCAMNLNVCPKCGEKKEIVQNPDDNLISIQLENKLKVLTESLPERKKRTILRHMIKNRSEIESRYEQLPENEKEDLDLVKLFPNLSVKEDEDMDFPDEFYNSESSEDDENFDSN